MRAGNAVVAAVLAAGLAGCATTVFNPATNEPLSSTTPPQVDVAIEGAREGLLALPRLQGYLRDRVSPAR